MTSRFSYFFLKSIFWFASAVSSYPAEYWVCRQAVEFGSSCIYDVTMGYC